MQLSQNQVRQIINHALVTDATGVRQLLSLEGVNTGNMNQQQLTLAVLKAIKDSTSFRGNFAAYIQRKATGTTKSFTGKSSYRNVSDVESIYISNDGDYASIDDIQPSATNSTSTVTPVATSATTSTSTSNDTGFFASLGSSIKNNLDKILGTGLDALSTKLKTDANSSSEQAALQLEQLRLQQINAKNAAPGMPTWAIVALSAAGIVVVGTIIYMVTKKKK